MQPGARNTLNTPVQFVSLENTLVSAFIIRAPIDNNHIWDKSTFTVVKENKTKKLIFHCDLNLST